MISNILGIFLLILTIIVVGLFLILSFVGPIVLLLLAASIAILIVNGVYLAFKKRTVNLKEITRISLKSFSPSEILPRLFGWTAVIFIVSIPLMFIFSSILSPPRLVDPAREGATKRALGAVRGCLVIYHGDNGIYPLTLDNSTHVDPRDKAKILPAFIPMYIERIPRAKLRRDIPHHDSDEVTYIYTNSTEIRSEDITSTGGWIYNPRTGIITVNSTCVDTRGNPYYTY